VRRALSVAGMRVAIVYKRYADTGGSERQVALLCAALRAQEHDVHVFCGSVRSAPPEGVTVHRMPQVPLGRTLSMLRFSAWAARAVAREQRRHGRFDVTQAFGRTVGQDVYRLGGGCHRTYLEHAHALDRPAWLRPLLRRLPYEVLKARLEERALSGARRRIITNSTLTRDDIVFRYALDPATIRVVRNGTDLSRFRPAAPGEKQVLRAELGLPAEASVAVFLGSGYARKGLEPTLRACALLLPRLPGLRLLVIGADRRLAWWRARAAALGLADQVLFAGPRRDPERLLRAADVSVLPTAYDPSANSTLESLASGLPVVTSDMNGAGEIIVPGVHGSVVNAPVHPGDVADALEHWLRRADRELAAHATRSLAAEFPAEDSCTGLLDVYREVIEARRTEQP
jgi:UDP-glucose:(heptosyl)LPS alpha-1,3-glucosyltransferase